MSLENNMILTRQSVTLISTLPLDKKSPLQFSINLSLFISFQNLYTILVISKIFLLVIIIVFLLSSSSTNFSSTLDNSSRFSITAIRFLDFSRNRSNNTVNSINMLLSSSRNSSLLFFSLS